MSKPKTPHAATELPVILELPDASRYEMGRRSRKLDKYLDGDHVPRLKPGVAAVRVNVSRGARGYVVSLAPGELETLLRHANPVFEPQAKRPPRSPAESNPPRGEGLHDPAAHRLGPNVDHRPDPGHRGTDPLRRKS